jgi:hypothetical protein
VTDHPNEPEAVCARGLRRVPAAGAVDTTVRIRVPLHDGICYCPYDVPCDQERSFRPTGEGARV